MFEQTPHPHQHCLSDTQHKIRTSCLDTSIASHALFQDRLSCTYQPVTPNVSFRNHNSFINKDKQHENKRTNSISSVVQGNNTYTMLQQRQHTYVSSSLLTATESGTTKSSLSLSPSQQQRQLQHSLRQHKMGDLSKTESAPSQQFIFKKPVYDNHYLSTHYNHLERHDSMFKEFKHLFKRRSRHGTDKLSDAGSQRSSKSGIGSSSGGTYSFGNEFNKDLKHHYGTWGTVIGKGSGGSVCVIRRAKDNKVFAVKEFRKREPPESERAYVKKVTAEFCIGSMLHHDNIIETLDIIREGSSFYQIMEYVPYDMFTIVMNTDLSPDEMACCWRQLLNGVDYLHQVGIGHRDLKLDNLVMDEHNIVKIIDFGTATVVRYPNEKEDKLSKGVCGSDPYIAPEQYNQPFYNAFSADLWSCGIIYVCMVLRRFAWYVPRPDMDANYQMYLDNRNSLLAYIPRYARPTIAHLLEPYPPDRCTMSFLLSDPWVTSIETCTPHRHYQHHHPPPCTNSKQPFSPI